MRTVGPRLAAGLIAGLVAGGPVLAGCGGSPEPKPLPAPTKSSSPSASASSAPTPPVMPEAAKAKTRAGAEVLVRHFLAALNYSGATGDTAAIRDAYVSLCTRCEAIALAIDKTYGAGGYYRGGDWLDKSITFYKIKGDVAILDARVDYTAQTWVKRKGSKPTVFPASTNHLHAFQLKWTPSLGWRVGALDPQQ
jgi:hypothetical protein